jgi:excisionase family DNA binding protein
MNSNLPAKQYFALLGKLASCCSSSTPSAKIELDQAEVVHLLSSLSHSLPKDGSVSAAKKPDLLVVDAGSPTIASNQNASVIPAIPQGREAFTVEEAAKLLELRPFTVRKYLREKRILGEHGRDRKWRIKRTELLRYQDHGPSQEYDPI